MYIIDSDKNCSIVRLNADDKIETYLNWIKENNNSSQIHISEDKGDAITIGASDVVFYFGFTLDEYISKLLSILPAKSADSETNKKLLEIILSQPTLSKSKCCALAGKSPTHFTRLAQTIRDCSLKVSNVSGGRNPARILESIRVDF